MEIKSTAAHNQRIEELLALSEPSAWANIPTPETYNDEVFYSNDLENKYLGQESTEGKREGFGTMVYS